MIEINGKVIKGKQYGRTLGFPTANLDRREYKAKNLNVKLGIWSGAAESGSGFRYDCAVVIGPIDKNNLPKIEAHLINFKGNIYGKKLRLILYKHIRPFRKFKNEDELKKQIAKDIIKIKQLRK